MIPEQSAIDSGEIVFESSFAPRVTSKNPYKTPVIGEVAWFMENRLQISVERLVIIDSDSKISVMR